MRRALPLLLLVACAPPAPRDYVNAGSGYGYTLPGGWFQYADEAKSKAGTLLSVQVKSLQGARQTFVDRLPDSLLPELGRWTRYYFIQLGEPEKQEATLGGEPAARYTFPIRIRDTSPPSRAVYWVARHGDLLYIVRVTFPPGETSAGEEEGLRQLLSTWKFVRAEEVPAPLSESAG